MVGTGKGAENGILVRDGAALEHAQRDHRRRARQDRHDHARASPTVTLVESVAGISEERELLRIAASAERGSEHPLAEAIVRHAAERGIETAAADGFEATPVVGVRASVDGATILVGTARIPL